jgi:hypothetical protein
MRPTRAEQILGGKRRSILDVAEKLENGTILVNVDRFGDFAPDTRIARRQLFWKARKYAADLVPVSFNALRRPSIYKDSIELIQRKGRECVFKAEGGDRKTHYYLSGFDRNEPRPLYFLSELPREVTGIKDAREALKPPSVVSAQKMGRLVYRQGDMFAIPTKITTEEILKRGGIIEDRETDRRFFPRNIKARKIYGTAHTATRVALMPDGTCLAWGYLYHEPRLVGRIRRDHRPCRLRPRRWHLVARNTVPVVKRDQPREAVPTIGRVRRIRVQDDIDFLIQQMTQPGPRPW